MDIGNLLRSPGSPTIVVSSGSFDEVLESLSSEKSGATVDLTLASDVTLSSTASIESSLSTPLETFSEYEGAGPSKLVVLMQIRAPRPLIITNGTFY